MKRKKDSVDQIVSAINELTAAGKIQAASFAVSTRPAHNSIRKSHRNLIALPETNGRQYRFL